MELVKLESVTVTNDWILTVQHTYATLALIDVVFQAFLGSLLLIHFGFFGQSGQRVDHFLRCFRTIEFLPLEFGPFLA